MADSENVTHRWPCGPSSHVTRRTFLCASAATAGVLAAPAWLREARAATVVKLGHTQPLTGPSAAYGIRSRDGGAMAIKEINDAGGFADAKGNKYTIQVTEDDMANDSKQAVTLFRQHALDPQIVASVGPTNSVGYLSCVPAAEQLKLPLIGTGSGAPVKKWNVWAFRVNPVSKSAVPVVLRTVTKAEHVKRFAVIYDQTQDAQAGDAMICRDMKGELGYEVVAFEAFRTGDQDFSPQVSKIRNAKPDAVYIAAATGDGVKVASQVRSGGIDAPLVTGFGSFEDPVYWDGTNGAIKGGYTWLAQDIKSSSGKLRDWVDQYNKAFKLEATSFSTYGYDGVWTAVEAVKRAGSTDRAKVREVLAGIEFTSPIGTKITFKNPPEGENLTPSVTVIKVTGRGTYAVAS